MVQGRKGLLLAQHLRKEGQHVAVIEKSVQNPQVDACRESGTVVILGDARDPFTLLKAGVRRAGHLVALCGDDSTNIEILAQAGKLVSDRSEELTLSAHIDDLQFFTLARLQEFTAKMHGARLEFFNTADAWARAALKCHPFESVPLPRLLLVSMNDTTERLILQAARQWTLAFNKEKLPITVVDEHGEKKVAAFNQKYSLVKDICQFSVFPYSPTSVEFERGDFLKENPTLPPVQSLFCLPVGIKPSSQCRFDADQYFPL